MIYFSFKIYKNLLTNKQNVYKTKNKTEWKNNIMFEFELKQQ